MKKIMSLLTILLLLNACSTSNLQYQKDVTVEIGESLTKEIIQLESQEDITFDSFDNTKVGSYAITFEVEDKSYPLNVTVQDSTPPLIKQKSEVTISQGSDLDFEAFFDISDNSGSYTITTTIDTSIPGTRNETLSVKDNSNNTASFPFSLTITEDEPVIIEQLKEFKVALNGTLDLTEFFTSTPGQYLEIIGDYDLSTAGHYPLQVGRLEVILTVDDGTLNSSYKIIEPATLRNDRYILANKRYQLPADYVPDNLINIPANYNPTGQKVTQETWDAFYDMAQDAADEGYSLIIQSAYRSYQTQETIYNNYLKNDPQEVVDTYSARPGHSEHQLGTTIDVCQGSLCFGDFTNTPAQQWMSENAYRYGFILRYPQGKEGIHGYMYESWHYRYVGVEMATHFQSLNLTFDEYYQQFIK